MELDLSARGSKWKREEEKRREAARRKLAAEQRRRLAAAQAREELEREQAKRRAERVQELARQEELALEEQRVTGGIKYLQRLRPVPAANDGDKIALPASALEELNPQGALELGVFTFELSFASAERAHRTHAGVLEFTAAEGTVGLPPKVAASLFQHQSPTQPTPDAVQVKFVLLEKGKFARLQPRGSGFGGREVDWKQLLERALKAHTTLTTGDVVLVRHGKETFEVRVVELQPEFAVNILNTDLEVALLPSEAVEQAAERAKEEERARELEAQRALELAARKERRKADAMARLAPEPPADERFQVKIVLRLPGGTQATRRFLHEVPLGAVFQLIEALTGDDPSEYQVAATYPRRLFGVDASDKSLKELALNGRQEALFVEKIATEAASTSDAAPVATSAEDENALSRVVLPQEWEVARQMLEQSLDEELHASASLPAIHAMEPAMPVAQSADQAVKWQAQLLELDAMGFTNRALNIEVLERYQGRLLRVVNYLSELGTEAGTAVTVMEE